MGGEKGVDLREGTTAEKAAVGAEGAGVRRFKHETRMGRGLARGGFFLRLCAPEHAECDQTALLEVLPQEILARLILPLGEFDKESVQEIAQDIGCAE